MSRKEGGLASIEDCINLSVQRLEDKMKKSKKRLIKAAYNRIGYIITNKKKQQQKLGNRNGKKNNSMDISSNKLPKSHTRRPGEG